MLCKWPPGIGIPGSQRRISEAIIAGPLDQPVADYEKPEGLIVENGLLKLQYLPVVTVLEELPMASAIGFFTAG